jgi:predicted nucleic acid-binding protein
MLRGIDTTFLVQVEVSSHPGNAAARAKLDELLDAADTLVLAPQVINEFIHIVTDSRRFAVPLEMDDAIARAEYWWSAPEVDHVFPNPRSMAQFFGWLKQHKLGRKRLLDTLLAATFHSHGVTSVVTTNARDFSVFGCFDVVEP